MGKGLHNKGFFAWEHVFLPLQGKVTLSDLRVFRIDFLDAQRGVPDVGEGYAPRHLMAKLPTFFGERIFKKEFEKTKTSKRIHINLGGQVVPPSEMRGLIRECGPLEMESEGDGVYEVLMPSEESVERLLTFNYQEVENSEQVLLVKKCRYNFLWSKFSMCSKSTWLNKKTWNWHSLGEGREPGGG